MISGNNCNNILLAIDGSEHSNAALNLILDLQLDMQCVITALSVLDTPHTPRRQILLAALEHTRKQLSLSGFNVKTGILHGHPAQTLMEYANDHKPDIIVFGAKGRRATLGILLGGVAQQLVEYSNFPVLAVRPPYKGLRRILLLTDGSEYSQRAIDFFLRFPIKKDATFFLVYVSPPLPSLDPEVIAQTWPMGAEIVQPVTAELPSDVDKIYEEEKHRGEKMLNDTSELLKTHGIKVKRSLLQGDAATEILEFSKINNVDLIVAGSRGLSQVQGWLLGSVSRKLMHYANCSILIVKG